MRFLAPVALATSLLLSPLCVSGCAGAGKKSALPERAPAAGNGSGPGAPLFNAELIDDASTARAIREHYTKMEARVPMRDGTRLFTNAYIPRDRSRPYPILLMRTPYGVLPYGADAYPPAEDARMLGRFAPSTAFIRQGYIIVHQDVRGRMMSEGAFVEVRPHRSGPEADESTDAYDTIDWLVKNVPGNNGRVGMWGVSYPGFYAAQGAVDAHPALKAVSPQAPVTEWFVGDDFHHNGAFFLADAFGFMASFGKARPEPTPTWDWGFDYKVADAYDFYLAMGPLTNANARYLKNGIASWNDMQEHGVRDAYWKARDPRPFYKNPKPAVMTVGGWFDAQDLYGSLATYRAFEAQSPKTAANTLVMGPWRHGGWARTEGDHLGELPFGQKTSAFYRANIEFPFFEHHLNGKPAPDLPEAWMFETGTNAWKKYSAWPPPEAKPVTFTFRAHGMLATTAANGTSPEDATGFDAFVSDPQKPVPYRAKPGREIDEDYMTDDQRFAARRPDVLVYETPVLERDVTLAGPLEANLWFSTTGTDADVVVKLIDVQPEDTKDIGGYQVLVRAEVMRGKFRTSFEKPEAFRPNEPTLVRFTIPDTNHTFLRGHRIMVHVQSSWFPLVDRNPQTFTDIYRATEKDFRVATHRVYRTGKHASFIQALMLGDP